MPADESEVSTGDRRNDGWRLGNEPAARQLAAVDATKRRRLVGEMQRIVSEDVPHHPLHLTTRTQIFLHGQPVDPPACLPRLSDV